jgi:predicted nucleic acid-binding protein
LKVFLDTSALVGYYNEDDTLHEDAAKAMGKFLSGEIPLTKFYTSDYVFDEVLTIFECALKRHDLAVRIGEALQTSPRISILKVDDETFHSSWKLFVSEKGLSFTDCTSFALIKALGIQAAFTFDRHFRKSGVRIIP